MPKNARRVKIKNTGEGVVRYRRKPIPTVGRKGLSNSLRCKLQMASTEMIRGGGKELYNDTECRGVIDY
jgi:hypothetical protein